MSVIKQGSRIFPMTVVHLFMTVGLALCGCTFSASPGIFIASIVLTILAVFQFRFLVGSDPGFLPVGGEHCNRDKSAYRDDAVVLNRSCLVCSILDLPIRARHCESCRRCVLTYDHHCTCSGICIGERNHALFLSYLVSELAVCALQLYKAANLLDDGISESHKKIIVILIASLAGLGSVVSLGLLGMHSVLVYKGVTTWEFFAQEKITYLARVRDDQPWPFDKGLLSNLSRIFRHPQGFWTFACLRSRDALTRLGFDFDEKSNLVWSIPLGGSPTFNAVSLGRPRQD